MNKSTPYNFKDLTGHRFGRLIVIRRVVDKENEIKSHTTFWECECDCGKIIVVRANSLKNGDTTSCGCYHKEQSSIKNKKYNQYEFDYENNICTIIDASGNSTIIDLEDYDKIKNIYWFQNRDGYWEGRKYWKDNPVKLHRFIMNAKKGSVIDHREYNPQDNRKSKLRECSIKQNVRNSSKVLNNTSGERGVGVRDGKYYARIQYEGKGRYLKQYNTLEEAKYARAVAEDILFEEFSAVDWNAVKIPSNAEEIKQYTTQKANKIKAEDDE